MKLYYRWAKGGRSLTVKTARVGLMLCLLAGVAASQTGEPARATSSTGSPEAEFHMARMVYRTRGGAGSRGIIQPWWAIDYPLAEAHFLPALRRLTNIEVAEDSRHLEAIDERIFDYPFLFLQQPGQGYWSPNGQEAAQLREYLLRGGFLLVDDFHGEQDWFVFQSAIQLVLPDREIVEIPATDPLMHIFFDLGQRVQIPGDRHLRGFGGQIGTQMEGPPHWRGIYDDRGRLMVAMNFNMDMGDAWEHADDPNYPVPMTAQAYQLGVNYVIYAMTH